MSQQPSFEQISMNRCHFHEIKNVFQKNIRIILLLIIQQFTITFKFVHQVLDSRTVTIVSKMGSCFKQLWKAHKVIWKKYKTDRRFLLRDGLSRKIFLLRDGLSRKIFLLRNGVSRKIFLLRDGLSRKVFPSKEWLISEDILSKGWLVS